MKQRWPYIFIACLVVVLAGMRLWLPERPLDYTGPRAIVDTFFVLGLLALVLLWSGVLGWKILLWLKIDRLTNLEQWIFSLVIGMGMMAYGVFALGVVGLLKTWAILIWFIIVGLWTINEWSTLLRNLPCWLEERKNALKSLDLTKHLVILISTVILVVCFLQTLTPPTGYDGLMFHLQGPRLFLNVERIILLPENWQSNGPFTVEMLFLLGLAFDSDIFSQLIHLVYTICLLLATYSFTRRFVGSRQAWISFAILLGIPLIPYLAALPNVDNAWALYEFMAMYALFLWRENNRGKRWLVLAGLLVGLAIGIKYFALGWAGILCLWVLWESRKEGLKKSLVAGLIFGGIGLLVGSPWYLKNLILSGNPLYPFIFGGPGWDSARLGFYMKYAQGFGSGRDLLDYVLLPLKVYTEREKFISTNIELPSLLFPLVLLYPFTHRKSVPNILVCLIFLHLIIWALSTQITRYALPVFPSLSILTAYVLFDLSDRIFSPQSGRVLLAILASSMLILSLLILYFLLLRTWPLPVMLGMESKDDYLQRLEKSYPAQQFIKHELPAQAKVMLMWDGRSYYCDQRCLPDTDQSRWTRLFIEAGPDTSRLTVRLHSEGITHLYYSTDDIRYVNFHDITGWTQRAVDFFLHIFVPTCTKEVYGDPWIKIYELICIG
jgi:hypothetical protein